MSSSPIERATRRQFLMGLSSCMAVTAAPVYANAAGFLRGAGDIRRIKMRNARTGESMDMIYWIEGRYIKPALREINWFMRDWRLDKATDYDRRNIDIMAAALRLMDTDEPFQVISAYRSATTNAMLRSRSRGVARNSYHVKGMAADLKLQSRSIHQMAAAAIACKAGGVGRYGRSNFVHMDCGPVRTWRG